MKIINEVLKYHGFMCILPVYSFELGNCLKMHNLMTQLHVPSYAHEPHQKPFYCWKEKQPCCNISKIWIEFHSIICSSYIPIGCIISSSDNKNMKTWIWFYSILSVIFLCKYVYFNISSQINHLLPVFADFNSLSGRLPF